MVNLWAVRGGVGTAGARGSAFRARGGNMGWINAAERQEERSEVEAASNAPHKSGAGF